MKSMKLKLLTITIVASLLACTDEKAKVKEFAINFGTQVSKNQVDSVHLFYPNAIKCDSFALSFNADSIVVTETDNSNVFTVSFGSATINVEKAEDGKMTVTSSRGLFAYPDDKMSFARKTGMWEDRLTDAEFEERISNEDFPQKLIDSFTKDFLKKIKVKNVRMIKEPEFAVDMGTLGITVENSSDQKVFGSDYVVSIHYGWQHQGEQNFTVDKKKGKDIEAGGSILFTDMIDGHTYIRNVLVEKTISDEEFFNKYYKASGNEYKKYLDSKK